MTGGIAWAPLLPWPLIAALGGIGVALLAIGALRRGRGLLWRMMALAILVLALFNPRWIHQKTEPQKDVAVILADVSPSQGVGPRRAQTAAAVEALKAALAGMADLDVRIVEAGGYGPGGGDGTRLVEALETAVANIPAGRFAGALLITDGQVHDAPMAKTSPFGQAPIHLLLTGRPGERDRRIVIDQVPGYGLVGKEVTLSYRVEDREADGQGRGAAETVPVTVRVDGKEVARETAPVGTRQRLALTLEHAGPTVIELEAGPLADELSPLNNRAAVAVNGVRDRLRVLLVSGQPHPGERTWRNLLKSDPAVDLVHFTILRPPEKDDFTPLRELALIAFPVQELFEARLREFDLIVFDRYLVRHVLPPAYFQNIVEYVREGGALLVAAGPEFAGPQSLGDTALADILPARASGRVVVAPYRPTVTEVGQRHPVTSAIEPAANARPWGRWFRQIEGTQQSGAPLLSGPDGLPLLILDHVGEGRVAQFMTDHTWLWARGYDGGGPHAELLRRLAHWLMKEPELEEEALRAEARAGTLTVERRSLDPAPATVTVTAPSGASSTLTLTPQKDGRASATLPADEPGLYRAEGGERATFAAVGALNAPELADLRATPEPLRPLVEASGGAIRWLADGVPAIRRTLPERAAAGRGWIGLTQNGAEVVVGINQVALLPWWLTLTLALGALAAAWWREGR
ncbi:MAG: hypothetical protein RBS99_12895 [Rhodospirillales bacterium]|jgi:hypothetical protein|nr:hypothetical protein [Rhodospirillales bacterium]